MQEPLTMRAAHALGKQLLYAVLSIFVAGAALGDVCTQPTSFPLGHHTFDFRRFASTELARSSGWDPGATAADDGGMRSIQSAVTTYPVGLPNNMEPANLPRTWTFGSQVTKASLASAGFSTISIAGHTGVYLIDGYKNIPVLEPSGGVKFAITRGAIAGIRATNGESFLAFIVDSLSDGAADTATKFQLFGTGMSGPRVYFLHSESMGGDDAGGKGRHVAFYKVHIHGGDKAGSEHSDGVQINGGDFAQVIYSNVNYYAPMRSNGPLFVSNATNLSNVDLVGNVITGGNVGAIKGGGASKTGTYTDILACGNLFLGNASYTSWGKNPIANFSGGAPHWRENNTALGGRTSGVNQVGDSWSVGATIAVPSAEKTRLQNDVAKYETWISELRAAAGYSIGGGPAPVPGPALPPASPVLLP